jgi:hypothetical protein
MTMTAPSSTEAQKRLKGSIASAPTSSLFAKLFSRGGVKSMIRNRRQKCCVVGVLVLIDRSIPVDGLVMEIDEAGVQFRPASQYILDRTGVEVMLRCADVEIRGTISATSPMGYDVIFAKPLSASSVSAIMNEFGVSDDAARRFKTA